LRTIAEGAATPEGRVLCRVSVAVALPEVVAGNPTVPDAPEAMVVKLTLVALDPSGAVIDSVAGEGLVAGSVTVPPWPLQPTINPTTIRIKNGRFSTRTP